MPGRIRPSRWRNCWLDPEFGFNSPLLVDVKAGIIAGHGRLLAARKLGLTEVPVVVLDHLSETQRRAYIIADNKLAENAGWDEEMLRVELEALGAEGFDLESDRLLRQRARRTLSRTGRNP